MKHLSEIIDALGFDLAELSLITGISSARLSELTKEDNSPSMRELKLIAGALNISIADISLWEHPEDIDLLFRTQEENQYEKIAANKISRKVSLAANILGNTEKPKWLNAFGILEESYEEAERLANLFRHHFCKDDINRPLHDLPSLLSKKAEILLFIVDNVKIDGASGIYKGWPFICLSKRFPQRMLFTLAHELGHIVSHHNYSSNITFWDGEDSIGHNQQGKNQKSESFADAFASYLLLPTHGVAIVLQEVRSMLSTKNDNLGDIEIIYLSYFYGVSFEVAAYRCEQLGLLPAGGANSLYAYLIKHHGSPEKRAKEAGIPERPPIDFNAKNDLLLQKSIQSIEDGESSLGMVSEMLGEKISEILKLHSSNFH
ncbi:ImmA/IrrE family metallo-endopeptidase [Sneathiella glossodoripedis]|uniref:ImmA/IrrE family metallo-endopeptidase n=1 Tax=Sneathiella glossodoripedis TaxID=418853 RepID=UPI00046F0372|nr:XRE family transcriptional regulator [Sneathiella glossodoripedis]